MKRKPRTLAPRGAAAVIEASESSIDEVAPVVGRADGFYWAAPDGRQEFGPFETYELARADRDRFDDAGLMEGETLQEAESDIGIADWIDPQTGAPAEGASPPHIDRDG